MPAPWKRVDVPSTVGQIQAVKAKKHVTVFQRKPSAPGAGRPEVKAGFTACATETRNEPSRVARNVKMAACMKSKGLKTGQYTRKSRGKYALRGRVYVNGVLT